ncbi:hypothetical protein PCANB_003093 [Pneumocystis canis]|nr:hypothetical protein PCK1_003029 [Pneumocystis canis]KAG5438242.1 hypothetical protein PCANB_003093 [Pneumocystis canis]
MLKKEEFHKHNSYSNKILSDFQKYLQKNNLSPSEIIDMVIDAFQETQTDGFIDIEALEALGKKEGFECFQENYENGVTLSLGGKIIVIDIDLEKSSVYWKVVRVTTTWADSTGGQYFSPSTNAILLANFSESHRLSSFKNNFQRLTRLDRLSSPPTWDVFSAIKSLYAALKEIYDYELVTYCDPKKILCEKSGKPEIDTANVVGLSLWYWEERRHCSFQEKLWRIIIEAEERDILISSNLNIQWMNQKINLSNDKYDWITAPSDFSPSCQFVMILDPPVVIYREDIKQISKILELDDDTIFIKDFKDDNNLIYETILTSQQLPIHTERKIHLPSSLTQCQFYTLEKSTLYPSYLLKRIPFYHPRQIHSILRILRKYTLLQTLTKSYINDHTCKVSLIYENKYKEYIKDKIKLNITTFYEKNLGIKISFSMISHNLKIKLSIEENGNLILKDIYTNNPLLENIKSEIENVFKISEDIGISCEYIRQILNKERLK